MDNILKQKTDKIISDYKEDTKPIIKRLEKEITKLQKNAHALKSEIQNLKSSLKVEFIKQKYAYEIFKYDDKVSGKGLTFEQKISTMFTKREATGYELLIDFLDELIATPSIKQKRGNISDDHFKNMIKELYITIFEYENKEYVENILNNKTLTRCNKKHSQITRDIRDILYNNKLKCSDSLLSKAIPNRTTTLCEIWIKKYSKSMNRKDLAKTILKNISNVKK